MFSARTASWSSVRAVTMITGSSRVAGLRRICRHTSMPLITGSIQSSSTMSGADSAMRVSASCPSPASSTRLIRVLVPFSTSRLPETSVLVR